MRNVIIVLIGLLVCSCSSTYSQVLKNTKDRGRFGIRAGANYSSFTKGVAGNAGESQDIKFTPGVGIDAGLFYLLTSRKTKKLSFPMELFYSTINTTTDDLKYRFSLISINMGVNYNITKNLYAEFDFLRLGYYLTSKYAPKGNDESEFTKINALDFMPINLSMGIGLGYEFNNRMFASLRFSHGLIKELSFSEKSSTLQGLSFNIGYTF